MYANVNKHLDKCNKTIDLNVNKHLNNCDKTFKIEIEIREKMDLKKHNDPYIAIYMGFFLS